MMLKGLESGHGDLCLHAGQLTAFVAAVSDLACKRPNPISRSESRRKDRRQRLQQEHTIAPGERRSEDRSVAVLRHVRVENLSTSGASGAVLMDRSRA
jgi:hypothetical protein